MYYNSAVFYKKFHGFFCRSLDIVYFDGAISVFLDEIVAAHRFFPFVSCLTLFFYRQGCHFRWSGKSLQRMASPAF